MHKVVRCIWVLVIQEKLLDFKMKSYKFGKLEVWQISLALSDVFYELIKRLPKEEDFKMIDIK